ncbi:MAG: signal recognition particle-docking protein FtsY, partial [Abditibacteriaceae bacterium]
MLKNLFKKVTALVGAQKLDEEVLEELEEQLILSDVSANIALQLVDELRQATTKRQIKTPAEATGFLEAAVIEMIGEQTTQLHFAESGVTVWLFVGVNGVGKTTTIGKVAHILKNQGRNPLIAAGDTFRAAAIEQLQEWGKRTDCPVLAQQAGADPAAVVFDAINSARKRGNDMVLVDTAGRLHNKANLMNELAKISRVVEKETGNPPQETLLVLDATTGQNGLTQAKAFTAAAPLSGIVLTKWDGTAKGGIILTIRNETDLPVKLLGVGEQIDDICEFDA